MSSVGPCLIAKTLAVGRHVLAVMKSAQRGSNQDFQDVGYEAANHELRHKLARSKAAGVEL